MNSVFSLDDSTEPFWAAPTMNRSESEWALERFLQEVSVSTSSSAACDSPAAAVSVAQSKPDDDIAEIKKPQIISPEPRHQQPQHPLPHLRPLDHGNPSVPVDSEEYRAFLKSKLDLACAAVAMARASSVKPEDLPTVAEDQGLHASSGSQILRAGSVASMTQTKTNGASLDFPALPTTQSGSSREDSDDDELEGETETNDLTAPADSKRARRMQSNRESARRSRRRKQEQLSDLESQVGQLRDERTSLLTRFTDINQKCDGAAVDNRILKADIETLRAKVKMAEEQVKRVTGLNPMILARSNMPGMGMQFFDGHMNSSINDIVPMQPNSNQFFHSPIPGIGSAAPHLQRLNNNFPNNNLVPLKTDTQIDNRASTVGGMTPVQLPANGQNMGNTPAVHHVQKQIGTTVGPGGPLPTSESGLPHTVANDNQKK